MQTELNVLLKNLAEPSAEFSMAPFWFLNDKLSKREIKKQLVDFKEKGIDIIIVHPRIGLPKNLKYLSESYFSYYAYILKISKALDLKIIIYDDGMYPSGAAGGLVVEEHPEYKSLGLFLSCTPDGKVIEKLDNGKYLVEKYSEGRMRGIHYGEDDGEINQPYSADILNENAVDRFIELTHKQYYARFKEYFGDVIIGFFTDEPQALGRGIHTCKIWTSGLEEKIKERGGVLKDLVGLFTKTENDTTRLYNALIQELENKVYYKKLQDFCNEHGVSLVGHPAECDDIEKLENFDIPGQDLIFRSIALEKGDCVGRDSVLGKCSSDYARCVGKRRNANECLGVCGQEDNRWDLSPEDIKWYFDYLAVRGVNMFIPHAFYYSLRGKRKEERPPDVGPNTLYWKHYRHFSNYVKRLSWLMTDAKNLAKVMVVCENQAMQYEEVKYFYENQIEFNYVPKSFLSKCKIGERIQLNDNAYIYVLDNWNISKGQFPEQFYVKNACEVTQKEITFEHEQKNVRVSHFMKEGQECFFLVNSGNEQVLDTVKIPGVSEIIRYDLWSGKYGKLPVSHTEKDTSFCLSIERNESTLLIVDKENAQIPMYQSESKVIPLSFELVKHSKKKYEKRYLSYIDGTVWNEHTLVQIYANEVVEWFVNDKFVGVTFWNPHKLCISKYLKEGKNKIEARVIGSVANHYGTKAIPYGIVSETKEY